MLGRVGVDGKTNEVTRFASLLRNALPICG